MRKSRGPCFLQRDCWASSLQVWVRGKENSCLTTHRGLSSCSSRFEDLVPEALFVGKKWISEDSQRQGFNKLGQIHGHFSKSEKIFTLENKFQHSLFLRVEKQIIIPSTPMHSVEIQRFVFVLKIYESVCCLSFGRNCLWWQGLCLSLSLMRAQALAWTGSVYKYLSDSPGPWIFATEWKGNIDA